MQKYLKAAIELQASLQKHTEAVQRARGKADQTEYVQYCTLITHCISNGIAKKSKAMSEMKTALEQAGRSERNVVSVVQIVAHKKLWKLIAASHEGAIASITPEQVIGTLAGEHDLDTVSKLRRYITPKADPVKGLIETLTKLKADNPKGFEMIQAAMERLATS